MCVYTACVSASQTLTHIIWDRLEDLLKCRLLGPTQRVYYSVGLGWALRICVSNKVPDTDAVSLGTPFGEPLSFSQRSIEKRPQR